MADLQERGRERERGDRETTGYEPFNREREVDLDIDLSLPTETQHCQTHEIIKSGSPPWRQPRGKY